MSPYEGEEPLSLIFAIVPLVVAGVIVLMILWRMVPELIALRRFRDEAPDWRVLRRDPALEREIEGLYIARRQLRERLAQASAAERDERLRVMDELLRQATGHAVALIEGREGVDREAERAGLDGVKGEIAALCAGAPVSEAR
jgi:hypothetical protein